VRGLVANNSSLIVGVSPAINKFSKVGCSGETDPEVGVLVS